VTTGGERGATTGGSRRGRMREEGSSAQWRWELVLGVG